MLTFTWNGMDPYETFALEYDLATEDLQSEPVIFLWRTRPGLMLGHYQNSYQEVHADVLKARDLYLVRRKSGGGTIYTDPGTIQYSIIDPDPSPQADFIPYMAPLVDALRAMGYPVQYHGRNDLEMGGKKCSGHAQYRRGGTLVHHGSLLVQADLDAMVAASHPDPLKMASKGIRSVRERVTNIDPTKSRPMEAFMADLGQALAREAKPLDLKILNWDRIRALARDDFASWEAIYGANPAFSVVHKRRFAGGSLEVAMAVKKGVIEDLALSGDYFAGPDYDAFLQVLLGSKLDKADLTQALAAQGIRDPIRGIPLDAILDLVVLAGEDSQA